MQTESIVCVHRYARILAEQENRKRESHEKSRQVLRELTAPFPFHERDREQAAAAATAAAAVAADAARMAVAQNAPFRAKPVPSFIRKVPICPEFGLPMHAHAQNLMWASLRPAVD